MRILINIILLIFYSTSFGQRKTSTIELEHIADKFGVDSAIRTIEPFIDIYHIDTTVALSLGLRCLDLTNYSLQLQYFAEVGKVVRDKTINSRAINSLKSYKLLLINTPGYGGFVIPDEIFAVIVFQKDTSTISILTKEFEFWERSADSIKNKHPSRLKRFFQRFKGTPPSEQLFSDCKQNSFKLGWVLNKFGVGDFTNERVNSIRQQLVPYLREYNMDRYIRKSSRFASDTIRLVKKYVSINEINFDNEPDFQQLKENLEGEKCWKRLFTNGNFGLYEIGCQWAPVAGRGKVLRLELIEQNKLVVKIVGGWRS